MRHNNVAYITTAPMHHTLNQLILLCRSGFEKECAGEIMAIAKKHQHPGYVQTSTNSGTVSFFSAASTEVGDPPCAENSLLAFMQEITFSNLIFPRQWFLCGGNELALPETNRIPDILQQCKTVIAATDEHSYCDIELDYADTNEGKSLNKFCRQFKPHLTSVLKKNKLLSAHSSYRLHLLFSDSLHVSIGLAPVSNSAQHEMGLTRLKMPAAAPSRSTLKLDEAILWFLSKHQQTALFKKARTAVDLGAAPGGWTWQLVKRGCTVTAIDNGPMQAELMETGKVNHLKTDAFTYAPDTQVDWLVCDMAERPLHVSRLIARWFTQGYCRNAIFNLKLPMKKRLASVEECLQLISETLDKAGIDHSIRAKHLYHDREEITVCILCT